MADEAAHTNATTVEWALFNAAVCAALVIDLVVSNSGSTTKGNRRGAKTALVWTVVWVAVSLLFDLHLLLRYVCKESSNVPKHCCG
eukprot:SAG11_NODE_2166_length_3726_cov_6.269369_4_plen_86_part_00